MTTQVPPQHRPVRVLHYARTELAAQPIARAMQRPGAAFRRTEDFDTLLDATSDADLLLLTDPGLAMARRLCAALDAAGPRRIALHILSAGREGFAAWRPPPHVTVSWAGSALAPTVAEHALALILSLLRGLHQFGKATAWTDDRACASHLRTLEGANLLIIGCGQIGQGVARRARPFGPRITGMNRTAVKTDAFDRTAPLSALMDELKLADVVVLCLPLTPDTRGLLGRDAIAMMRRGAILINVGRGGLVDEAALAEALADGRLAGAGLDVFDTEPLPSDSPLWRAPNAILTPHIAGLGGQGEARIALSAAQALERLLPSGHVHQNDAR